MSTDSDSAPPGDRVTVVLADDHELVRDGIRMVLEAEPDIDVVAQAGDAETAARYVLGHKPTILVLDLSIPGARGLDAFRSLRQIRPNLPVLVLTIHPEDQFGVRALRAGAAGYLNKETAPEELVTAVRRILGGGTYMSPDLAEAFALGKIFPQPVDSARAIAKVAGTLPVTSPSWLPREANQGTSSPAAVNGCWARSSRPG